MQDGKVISGKTELELQQKAMQFSSGGIDVVDWANDNKYFGRIFGHYAYAKTRADGTESEEKIIPKEDAERSIRQILTEKLDPKDANKNVEHLMGKFFAENWEYMDAADEGTIETTRAPALVHRIIDEIKMDDEEEGLRWKTH